MISNHADVPSPSADNHQYYCILHTGPNCTESIRSFSAQTWDAVRCAAKTRAEGLHKNSKNILVWLTAFMVTIKAVITILQQLGKRTSTIHPTDDDDEKS